MIAAKLAFPGSSRDQATILAADAIRTDRPGLLELHATEPTHAGHGNLALVGHKLKRSGTIGHLLPAALPVALTRPAEGYRISRVV